MWCINLWLRIVVDRIDTESRRLVWDDIVISTNGLMRAAEKTDVLVVADGAETVTCRSCFSNAKRMYYINVGGTAG